MGGKTKAIVDGKRAAAGVATFDQAVSLCSVGKGGEHVIVANNPKDSFVIWVYSEKPKVMFWMPKGSLDKK